jgi:hypothetical protein
MMTMTFDAVLGGAVCAGAAALGTRLLRKFAQTCECGFLTSYSFQLSRSPQRCIGSAPANRTVREQHRLIARCIPDTTTCSKPLYRFGRTIALWGLYSAFIRQTVSGGKLSQLCHHTDMLPLSPARRNRPDKSTLRRSALPR